MPFGCLDFSASLHPLTAPFFNPHMIVISHENQAKNFLFYLAKLKIIFSAWNRLMSARCRQQAYIGDEFDIPE